MFRLQHTFLHLQKPKMLRYHNIFCIYFFNYTCVIKSCPQLFSDMQTHSEKRVIHIQSVNITCNLQLMLYSKKNKIN